MNLKTYFRLQLIAIMEKLNKHQCDIYKNTSHNPGYVCQFLKKDIKHSLDVIERIANAIGCYVVIPFIPKSEAAQVIMLVQ